MNVLVIGNGFIGSHFARTFLHYGMKAVLASRHRRDERLPWIACDATSLDVLCRVVDDIQPDAIVLVHGPSDITWCESHLDEVMRTHLCIAQNLSHLKTHAYKILISTDNVFSGEKGWYDETSQVDPKNAYGRAKLAAEQVLMHDEEHSVVLRTSLVYGWADDVDKTWVNFFSKCVMQLHRGEPFEAPIDSWNSPILVQDLAEATHLFLVHRVPGLFHLAGPNIVSRFEWANIIATVFGFDHRLIHAVKKAETRFANRPTHSCLKSCLLGKLTGFKSFSCLGVREAAEYLKSHLPNEVDL